MKLKDYKRVFIASGLIGILLFSAHANANLFPTATSEPFSEIYLLGSDNMAQDIPFKIVADQNYSVYLTVGNSLGSSAYYVCYVKLRNETQSFPNDTTASPSSLTSLYEYRALIQDGENWTSILNFSFSNVSISNNQSLVQSITINDIKLDVNKIAQFDQANNGYYYQLFVELWAFNPASNTFEYQDRYVYFWLNLAPNT